MADYPSSLVAAVTDWVPNPNRSPLVEENLRAQLRHVDPEYRQCTVPCYRRMDFYKGNLRPVKALIDLFSRGQLRQPLASWTTDPEYARRHNSLAEDCIALIFVRHPRPGDVFLDIAGFWNSEKFQTTLKRAGCHGVPRLYSDNREVLLEPCTLTPDDIYLIAGLKGTAEVERFALSFKPLSASVLASQVSTGEFGMRLRLARLRTQLPVRLWDGPFDDPTVRGWLSPEESRRVAGRIACVSAASQKDR